MTEWQRFDEPLRATLVRTVGIAIVALAGLRRPLWVAWWMAGLAFIGIELVAQLALQLRGRPSFFNGRG